MPRLSPQRVPKYGKHKQSGQARVVLNGRHFLLGPHGSKASRDEYDRLIAEWVAGGRQLRPQEPGVLTVATLVNQFRKHAETYYRLPDGTPSREAKNFKATLRPLVKLYGGKHLSEFDVVMFKAVRQRMVEAGWCRSYVNRQMARIRYVFKWGVTEKLVPVAVYQELCTLDGLKAGRSDARESEPVQPVPEAHVFAIKDHVSAQVWAMVELQWLTGMRSGEVTTIRTGDIDTTGTLWIYRPRRHKTQHHGHVREIYLGERCKRILTPFLKPDLQAFIFSPAEAEQERRDKLHAARKTPHNCGSRPGTNKRRKPQRRPGDRYTVTAYLRSIYTGCVGAYPPPPEVARQRVPAAGRKAEKSTRWETPAEWKRRLGKKWAELCKWQVEHRWHPHQIRHAAGTRLRKEHGVEAAQVILGHKTLSVTELYAQKNVEAARRIMAHVG